ncbi:O-succinylbenzoate--CoA ligase [Modestobacter sp. Leaf380]|nr:O-succinylbenzoate--CoA ligase [Modestobacter sp. Leaf380]
MASQVERRPGHQVAVEDADGGRPLTIAGLSGSANRLAHALTGLGLRPGDRVAYVAQNHPEYVVLEFALLKAGLVKVPLNHRFAPLELRRCLELAEVRLVVADDPAATVLDEVLEGSDVLRCVVGSRPGWLGFADLVASGAPTRVQAPVGPDDTYHIRFSSGSTGSPKGIAISHRGARAAILGNTWVMSTSGPVAAPRTLQVAPLVYAGGWSVLPTLLCGGTNVVARRFDADEMLDTIADRGITWLFAVPTMLRRLSTSSQLHRLRASSLSCLMLAGEAAALPALEVVGQHTDALVQCWGQTEAPASTTWLSRTEMTRPELWTSIGRPVPGVEFSVLVDDEVADRPEPGVVGELVIRTPSIATALLGAEAERERRLLPDGWWRTSDLGYVDDEGRFSIVGRSSETIITGGTNIQPAEIERALESCPVVREAVVVGVPDARWGETPAAYVHVVPEPSEAAGQIDAWLRDRLAGFKRPGHVFLSTSPIPRASGESKVARGEIRTLVRGWVQEPGTVPADVSRVEKTRG